MGKLPEHFEQYIERIPWSGCWIWMGGRHRDGYGSFRSKLAHRIAYKSLVGDVPNGLELDHLCGIRCCTNPAHMEPVTHQVNVLRGQGIAANNARKTQCRFGHPLELQNSNRRFCRTCANEANKRSYRKRKDA